MKNCTFTKDFWRYLAVFLTIIILICCLPYLFTEFKWLDFTNTGQIGDTIGGIMGPFVAIAAAMLTFLAFWVQFKANEQQRNDIALERFDNHFIMLLDLYKNTTSSIDIKQIGKNKRAFHFIFYEYHTLLIIFKYLYIINQHRQSVSDDEIKNLSSLAISFLMCGTTTESNKRILHVYKEKIDIKFITKAIKLVNNLQKMDKKQIYKFGKIPELMLFNNYSTQEGIKWYWGMRADLIVYINMINTQVGFIENNNMHNIDKNTYFKIIYAQMSEHELGLLYAIYDTPIYGKENNLNSITSFIEFIKNDTNKFPELYRYNIFFRECKLKRKQIIDLIMYFEKIKCI